MPSLMTSSLQGNSVARDSGTRPPRCRSPTSSANLRGLPAGFVRRSGEFELLGTAFGAAAYCNQHACASAWTEPLNSCMPLPSCPRRSNCHAASPLLWVPRQACTGIRASHQPCLHEPALLEFDARVRACLEQVGALPLSPQAWRQALPKSAAGGLGSAQCGPSCSRCLHQLCLRLRGCVRPTRSKLQA